MREHEKHSHWCGPCRWPRSPRSLAQQPAGPPAVAPTFRVEVNYVEIDATVTDAQGNFVRDLTKDDFELVEEGEAADDQRLHDGRSAGRARGSAALSRHRSSSRTSGRTSASSTAASSSIVLDDLQTDFRRTLLVRARGAQFVRRFVGVNDLVAVVNDRRAHLAKPGLHEQPTAPARGDRQIHGPKAARAGTPPSELETVTKAENSLRSLAATAEFLGNVRGRRKAVVWFAEGVDYDIENPLNRPTRMDPRRDARSHRCRDSRRGQFLWRRSSRRWRRSRRSHRHGITRPGLPG